MSETKSQSNFAKLAKKFFSGVGTIILILIALFIFFTFMTDKFLTGSNMYNLARATAVNGIAALGMSICIYVGGIDLTIGSTVGFTSMLMALLTTKSQLIRGDAGPIFENWLLAVPVCLIVGIAVGMIVGWLVNDGGLPPYIATLSFQFILRACCQLANNASVINEISVDYKLIANTDIFGLPILAVIWVIVTVLIWLMMNHTRFGRNIYAVGSNAETARLCGISLRRTRMGTWTLSSILSVLAGILVGARIGTGMPTTGVGYETDAIASSVIGGASMKGGEGSIVGTFIGTIILQTIRNGSQLLGWNTFILEMIIGILIVVCVLLDKNGKQAL
ncbi:MAG: ABC transporter permease [Christensenellaceae bacterium]|nr:ABC transporter permease [Christensenellaceae bacterium]